MHCLQSGVITPQENYPDYTWQEGGRLAPAVFLNPTAPTSGREMVKVYVSAPSGRGRARTVGGANLTRLVLIGRVVAV